MEQKPLRPLLIEDPCAPAALPPMPRAERSYVPPAPPKSKRQALALEASLRRRARWERQG